MDNNNFNTLIDRVDEDDTLDVVGLLRYLWSKALILLLVLIIGAVASGALWAVCVTPMYKATSMIYVYSKTTSITSVADLQLGSQLKVDFQIIGTTREVLEASARNIGYDASYGEIYNMVSIENPADSHILQINVWNTDPVLACDLSNSIANTLRERIAEVMSTQAPSMVQPAVVPSHRVDSSPIKVAALGGAIAFAVVTVVFVVAYLLDDKIKTDEDIEKYLKQNVIATVPLVVENNKHSRGLKSKKKVAFTK